MPKRLTPNQKLWQKEIRRLEGYQRKLESKGITFKKSPIPQAKSRITRIALAKISSITYSDIASKGFTSYGRYVPKTKSKPRKPIFNLEEEKARFREQHLQSLKNYREKIEIRKLQKELLQLPEKWTPEQSKQYIDLLEREKKVLTKKEKEELNESAKRYEELSEYEKEHLLDKINIPVKEDKLFFDNYIPDIDKTETEVIDNYIPEVDYYQQIFDQIRNMRENPNTRMFLLTKLMSFKSEMKEEDRRKELNAIIKANKASIDIEVVHLGTISEDTRQRVANAVKLYHHITNDRLDMSDRIRLTKAAEEDQVATQY